MTADPYAITIRNAFQGASLPFTVTFWDTPPDPNAVPPVVGVPHDTSLWHFMFTMRKDLADPDTEPPAIYVHGLLVAAGTGANAQADWTGAAVTSDAIDAKLF